MEVSLTLSRVVWQVPGLGLVMVQVQVQQLQLMMGLTTVLETNTTMSMMANRMGLRKY